MDIVVGVTQAKVSATDDFMSRRAEVSVRFPEMLLSV
jgi:hypothetical protein